PLMTTRAWSGRRSYPGMQDGVLAYLDESLELFVDPRIDARVGVVREQLLPLLVRHPVRRPRPIPLPAVKVLGRRDPGPIEPGPVMPHRVLAAQVVATGTNFAHPVSATPLVIARVA